MARQRARKVSTVSADGPAGVPDGAEGTDSAPDRSAYGHIADRLESLKTRQFASGRRAAVEALDCLLGDHHNIQKLYDSLQRLFDAAPGVFVRDYARLFMTPIMLEAQSHHTTAEGDTARQAAKRTLLDAIKLAFQTRTPAAVVAARRELSLLEGLQQDDDDALTAETLRKELLAMEASITGGNGNGRRRRILRIADP